MEKTALDLTLPEASLAFLTILAFSDDNPSEEEGVIMRKYFRLSDAESLQSKLSEAGYTFPGQLTELENTILQKLKSADRTFKLRTLAVGLLLAKSDGIFDRSEMSLLSRYGQELEISLAEAEEFARIQLREIDETTGYTDTSDRKVPVLMDLSPDEAGIALAGLVSFSDGEPSYAEAGVIREFYAVENAEKLLVKMKSAGLSYPEGLSELKSSIIKTLNSLNRESQKKILAVAFRVAAIDGQIFVEEIEALKPYCEEFYTGIGELKDFFRN